MRLSSNNWVLHLTTHDPVLLRSLFGYFPGPAAERPLAIWGDIAGPGNSAEMLIAATPGTLDSLLADPSLRLVAIVRREFVGPSHNPPPLSIDKMATEILVQRWNARPLDTYLNPQFRQPGPIRPAPITSDDAGVLIFEANWYPQTLPPTFFGIAPATGFLRVGSIP